MPSKKLSTLLASFSAAERSRFRRYLASPYFNENECLARLLELIENDVAAANGQEQKKRLWQQLFVNKPFDDAQMRRLLSDLIHHALNFLAISRNHQSAVPQPIRLLELLNDPGLELHFSSTVRRAVAHQEKSALRNADFHYHQYLLEERWYEYYERKAQYQEMLDYLQRADFQLDCYYVSLKLRHFCDALSYRNFLPVEPTIQLPPQFLDWVQHSAYWKEPAVEVYFWVAKMLLQPEEEEYYRRLKQLLEQKSYFFSQPEQRSLYIHLVNYCIDTKINLGNTGYFAELFDVFKISLERQVWLEAGVLEPQYYKTIISVGLAAQEFGWVEQFIRDYTNKLPPEDRENALAYNLAKVYFQQQQYEKVIELLREVEYQNLNYALGGKLMLLKTYYELQEYLALDSLIDSFRAYLRRHQSIAKETRQQYLNILRFVKKLSNVMPGDKEAIGKIRQEVDQCKTLADKNWILEKVAELEKAPV